MTHPEFIFQFSDLEAVETETLPTAQLPAHTASEVFNASPHPPSPKSSVGVSLRAADLPTLVSTYRDNEMRFQRDFVGRRFSDVLPFLSAKENMFIKGTYRVGFGLAVS